jgi:Zn-dependent membrane protease YugP
MYLFNSSYMLYMLPAFIIMLVTQWYVNSSYKKWSRVPNRNRLSGADAAQRLIRNGGLNDVRIEGVAGNLTDHYDPRQKVLRLSEGVYQSQSVAAVAIAAHELGHAMQDHEDYFPLRIRAALVPAVNIGSTLGWILIFIGFLIQSTGLAVLGLIIFAGGAVFALATLPVELNASSRAKRLLAETGLITGEDEQRGVNQVLNAAALTYVAALITAVMQVLYFASMIFGGRRR